MLGAVAGGHAETQRPVRLLDEVLDFAQISDDQFISVSSNGYCQAPSVYPYSNKTAHKRGYAETDDVEGLNSKQTCLMKCVESHGLVEGIYLPNGKCGCCSTMGGGVISHSYYHLYRVADAVVA